MQYVADQTNMERSHYLQVFSPQTTYHRQYIIDNVFVVCNARNLLFSKTLLLNARLQKLGNKEYIAYRVKLFVNICYLTC